MKRLHLGFGILPLLATVLFGGCAGAPAHPGGPGVAQVSAAAPISMTMPRYVPQALHADHSKSWMRPQKKKSILMYVGDLDTNDVDVYEYPSGTWEGTLTGFDYPYGGCVDAKGDVYISNFSGGTASEYAHGGTTVLNTYSSGGEPIGCSVDAAGDLAVTSFSPATVTVFAGGDPTKGTTYASCAEYQWTMGYDDKGNLIGVGYGSLICALLKGATSITTLSDSGITIDFPRGTMWDGKYVALGDQEAGGTFNPGLWPATLAGKAMSSKGEVAFDGCEPGVYVSGALFILGKKNTPVNHEQGMVMVALSQCTGADFIGYWHYPKGGDPYKDVGSSKIPGYANGLVVSIGR
jgi:hypothetical protein